MPEPRKKATNRFLTGDRELDAMLRNLSDTQTNQLGRKALNAAASNTSKEMKKTAPKDTGALKRSIGVKRAGRGRKSGDLIARVGARSDEKYNYIDENGQVRKPYKYSHLQELGTDDTPPSRFMTRAARNTEVENKRIMAKKIEEEIAKQVKKAQRKGKTYLI